MRASATRTLRSDLSHSLTLSLTLSRVLASGRMRAWASTASADRTVGELVIAGLCVSRAVLALAVVDFWLHLFVKEKVERKIRLLPQRL